MMDEHDEHDGGHGGEPVTEIIQELGPIKGIDKLDDEAAHDIKRKLDKQELHRFRCNGKTYLRKKRVPLEPKVRERLEQAFQSGMVPRGRHGRAAKEKLAMQLDLSLQAVNKWFDNRRVKDSLQNRRLIQFVDGGLVDKRGSLLDGMHDAAAPKSPQPSHLVDPDHQEDHLGRDDPVSEQNLLQDAIPPLNHELQPHAVQPSSTSAPSALLPHPKRARREFHNLDEKLEENNLPSHAVSDEVRRSFRIIRLYFAGEVDLWKSSRDGTPDGLDGLEAGPLGPSEPFSRRTRRKALLAPSLQNVIDHMLSKDSVLAPLVEAVQIISGNGATRMLLARVHLEEQNFRTLMMWYVIGKFSGEKTCEYMIKSLTAGLHGSLHSINVAEQIEKYFPALIESKDRPDQTHVIFTSDMQQQDLPWSVAFIGDLFLSQKVHGEDGEPGEVVAIMPPPPRSGKDPLFRVHFPNTDRIETYSWTAVRTMLSPSFQHATRNL